MEQYPAELINNCIEPERSARIGRFLILKEMGYFGDQTNLRLSKSEGEGSWMHQVRRAFSGIYGDMVGCHPGDIEVAAEMLGVFDDVFDVEAGRTLIGDAQMSFDNLLDDGKAD